MGGRCFPPVGDGGVSDAGSDASAPDSGTPRDVSTFDAADGSLDVTPPGSEEGCGCRAGAPSERSSACTALAFVGALAAASRRRRRR